MRETQGPQGHDRRPRGGGVRASAGAVAVAVAAAAALVGVLAGVTGSAAAQSREEVAPEVRAEARQTFREGIAAARQGNWETARQRFARAYELVPVPGVLLNLAGAQRQTGRLVQSARSYQKYLDSVGPDDKHRDTAEQALEEVRQLVPRVAIEVEGLGPDDEVTVDGRPIEQAGLAEPVMVNAGSHRVAVRRDGEELDAASFEVYQRQQHEVALEASATAPSPRETAEAAAGDGATGAPEPAPGGDEQDSGLVRSPWLWTGVGAAVLAGVAVGVGVALAGGGASSYDGNLPPGSSKVR